MIYATVLRSGGAYAPEWVYALRRSLNRHAPDARLVVLTDVVSAFPPAWVATGGVVDLAFDWPGWWSKAELGRPGLFEPGELVFFTDLDSLVLGDLSDLARYTGDFATLRDFYTPSIAASGAMLFRAGGPMTAIYEAATSAEAFPPPRHGRSDPWWNGVVMPDAYLQDEFPGWFGSFKADDLEDGPGEFRHVSFHGQPKMGDFPAEHWVARAWRDLRRVA